MCCLWVRAVSLVCFKSGLCSTTLGLWGAGDGVYQHHMVAAMKGLIGGAIASPAVTKWLVEDSWDTRQQLRQRSGCQRGPDWSNLEETPQQQTGRNLSKDAGFQGEGARADNSVSGPCKQARYRSSPGKQGAVLSGHPKHRIPGLEAREDLGFH